MKRGKRLLSLLLAVLMLGTILPPVTRAAPIVYFTSINDTICNLNDETMPFWSDGVFYIPHTAIDDGSSNKELGIYCAYNREKKLVTLYRQRKVLVFDTAKGTAYDNDDPNTLLGGKAIVRGDIAFLPLDTVTKFFSLGYSYLKVNHGYLIRIKSKSDGLPDSKFIDAATSFMEDRYKQYEKTHGSSSVGTQNNGENSAGKPVYLTVAVSGSAAAESVLTQISASGGAATFVFDSAAPSGSDDLLRHIVISGSAVALRVDASRGAEQTVAAIERANEQLWTASNTKTRLVCLDDAPDAVLAAVRAAGYCPVSFALDYHEELPSASRAAGSILSLAGKQETCSVFLGSAEQAEELIASLTPPLRAEGCTLARLNEVVA